MPDLSEALLRSARIPALTRAGIERGSGTGLLPPEPTLRDLAVLGSLQEKVSILENAVSQFQEDLRHRDTEMST